MQFGVDPVTWTPICYMKGVHHAEDKATLSKRVS
jgi:hypothetical protein